MYIECIYILYNYPWFIRISRPSTMRRDTVVLCSAAKAEISAFCSSVTQKVMHLPFLRELVESPLFTVSWLPMRVGLTGVSTIARRTGFLVAIQCPLDFFEHIVVTEQLVAE